MTHVTREPQLCNRLSAAHPNAAHAPAKAQVCAGRPRRARPNRRSTDCYVFRTDQIATPVVELSEVPPIAVDAFGLCEAVREPSRALLKPAKPPQREHMDEGGWTGFTDSPLVKAGLDAVPDPVDGLFLYRGRGGSSSAPVPRRPKPAPIAAAAALPEPETPAELVRLAATTSISTYEDLYGTARRSTPDGGQ